MTPEELLKEVGEPVLYAEFAEDGGWLGDASEYADHLEEPHALFTSDQVSAAIIKATKPLEEKLTKAEQRAEWQPISTAPKDGTVFLGYKLGQFRECYKVPRDDCDMWCFGGVSGADDLFPNIKPTHWMPLPTPPKRSMEGVQETTLNDLKKIQDAIELLGEALDASPEEIIECLENRLIFEEEASSIKDSMK